jgi:hypothetical protein
MIYVLRILHISSFPLVLRLGARDSAVYHATDVLRKTQEQRKLLDDNINSVLRKHKEINAFLDAPCNERYFVREFFNAVVSFDYLIIISFK